MTQKLQYDLIHSFCGPMHTCPNINLFLSTVFDYLCFQQKKKINLWKSVLQLKLSLGSCHDNTDCNTKNHETLLCCSRRFWQHDVSCVCLFACFITVRQRARVRPAPPEQAVPKSHLLCGVWRRASSHPWPDLGAAQTVPRHTLPPQQRQVEHTHTRTHTEKSREMWCSVVK